MLFHLLNQDLRRQRNYKTRAEQNMGFLPMRYIEKAIIVAGIMLFFLLGTMFFEPKGAKKWSKANWIGVLNRIYSPHL
jgi:hypothetical protein